jgi:DNA-binding CsgD family transcriptional regulator/tetratricopeptide (TPR) repeat protein
MHLLERREQLGILNRCLGEARAGSGRLVLITGEAGFGKSALVEQFVSEIRGDALVLWGSCDALDTPRALGAVHEIASQTPIYDDHLNLADESRDALFRALFVQLARPEHACVVVLEDLHWADESTLDFVRFIGRRIQRTRALFVATYRDEELPPIHAVRLALGELTGRHVIRMRLRPLSAAAVAELANDSGWDAARLHAITGGNPFFVREALASPDEHVPRTVRDAVLARLMRCSPSTRELAELVSISPGKTEAWLLESVLGARASAVDEGVVRGLLSAHSDAVSFRHELARLAVHSTLPPERARAMHDRVLAALVEHGGADLSELVHHAMLANNAAAVLEYAPLAGRDAARLGSHREAAAHLGAALRYSDSLPRPIQAEFFEHHARECSLTNQTAPAIASANRALALWRLDGDVEAQSRVLSFLTPEYRMAGDNVRADESIADAIALLEPLPPGVHLALAYGARSRLASNRGLDKEAVDFGQRALVLAREFGDSAIESHALNSIGAALLIAGDLCGYEPLERSLAVALEKNLAECAARAYSNLVFCATLGHDFIRAERVFREGVAYCEEHGLFSSAAYVQAYGARLALDRGDWAEAARRVFELTQTAELAAVQRVPTRVTLALVRIRRGDPGADDLLDEVYDLALSMDEPERAGRVTAARAEQAWYRGDLERVARETAIGLDHLAEHKIPWVKGELLFWRSRAQVVDSNLGDIAEPYRLMLAGNWDAAADAWEQIGMPYEQALCLAEGSDEALLRSLAILDRLGAGPLEVIVRRRLRERGVRGVPRGPREKTRANPAGLSATECEVLALLVEGCSNAQIAHRLSRSTRTVDHHVSAVLGKLGVRSRAEAVVAASALGIVNASGDGAARRRP